MIFCRTRAGAIKLGSELGKRGIPASVLQGDLSQKYRDRVMRAFKKERTPLTFSPLSMLIIMVDPWHFRSPSKTLGSGMAAERAERQAFAFRCRMVESLAAHGVQVAVDELDAGDG